MSNGIQVAIRSPSPTVSACPCCPRMSHTLTNIDFNIRSSHIRIRWLSIGNVTKFGIEINVKWHSGSYPLPIPYRFRLPLLSTHVTHAHKHRFQHPVQPHP